MKKLFAGLLLSLVSLCAFSQTPDPDAYGESVITLDISTLRFDKILPFDKPFIIHLKNITSSYNAVSISIYENGNISAAVKKNHSTTGAVLTINDLIINLESWTRPVGGNAITEADIIQPLRLSPNSDYIVKISVGTKANLSKTQKDNLTTALLSDVNTAESINQLASAADDVPASILSKYRITLNKQFGDAIKAFNPDFIFTPLDWVSVHAELQTFRQSVLEVKSTLELLKSDIPDGTEKTKLIDAINGIVWGTFDLNKPEWISISAYIEQLKTNDIAAHNGTGGTISTNLDDLSANTQSAIESRNALRDEMITGIVVPSTVVLQVLNSTYRADFVNNARFHINLDAGYAYVWRADRAMAYSGFNIYFRPVDKTVPLSRYDNFWESMSVRTSMLIGISLSSIEKDGARKGLIDNKAFILGAGIRVLSFLKINGGAFCHYRYEQNPVIDPQRYHFSMSPFCSLSLDLDVKPLFTGLSDSLFK